MIRRRNAAALVVVTLVVVSCTDGGDRSPTERTGSRATPSTEQVKPFATPREAAFGEKVPPSCPAGIDPDVETFTWRRGAPMRVPRTEVAAAALFDRVYVAGGFTADGRASAVVELYDPKSDRWSRIPDLPSPRHHAGLVAADGRLWLIGGYDDGGEPTSTVWRWAVGDRRWSEGPPLPTARGALALAVVWEGIHAIGGATGLGGGNRLSDEHTFLAQGADDWTTLDPLPEPRDHLAAAGSSTMSSTGGKSRRSGRLYVVGGRHLSLDTNEARVDAFNIPGLEGSRTHWRWTSAFTMPHSRGGLAAATSDVLLLVFGGEQPDGTIGPVDYFEVEDGIWCGAPPMPTPRHGLGAVTIGRRVYVVGGGPTPGLSVSGANEILEMNG